jgi:hypothetical protein
MNGAKARLWKLGYKETYLYTIYDRAVIFGIGFSVSFFS